MGSDVLSRSNLRTGPAAAGLGVEASIDGAVLAPAALGGEDFFRAVLDALPVAVYTTDASGRINYFNRAVVALAGRVPELHEDQWCVAHKLFWPDGSPLPHAECPMAVALAERRPVRDTEVVAERPDGQRVPLMPFPTPLFDADGAFVGGVNLLVDVAELKRAHADVARKAEAQAALYRFTDRLYRARSLEDVYEAALDAIISALRCDRASILLFDGGGVMRFAAWRGLSDPYRQAVEGHSPWTPADSDPQPIWIADIDEADEPESLKAVVRAENIRGLAFIPLVAGGRLVGKFMAYHAGRHDVTAEEIDLAVTLARQLGFAIEQRRAEDARAASEQQRTLLIHELNHRVKNTLATVQSMVMQTLRNTERTEEAQASLEARLALLSRAHDVLTHESWQGAFLDDVVLRALEPFRTADERLTTRGPRVRLSPKQALAISIALHELATNAAKYGALSNAAGRVDVAWSVQPGEGGGLLEIDWRESGGPPVAAPTRSGFGTRLLERSLASELDAETSLSFRPEGVAAVIRSRVEPEGSALWELVGS